MSDRSDVRDPVPPIGAGPLPAVTRTSIVLVVLGLLASAGALVQDLHRFAFTYLWAFALAWTVVVGCLFFVALQHLTKSVWSVVIRRVAETFASATWVLVILALPVLLFAWRDDIFHLYPWIDPAHTATDALLRGKAPYLNLEFLTLRLGAFLLLWWLFARFFVGASLAQDRGPDANGRALAMRRRAPVFMLVFAATVSFAAFDLLMSLNPHWFSTIFGVYVFSGMFVSALAVITLAVLYLRAQGRLGVGVVRGDHLFSLGALLFAMSCFWAYIAFSQYLLIWNAHLPEETGWYVRRLEGGWLAVTLALPVVRFVVPFLVLMSRPAKMSPRILAAMAVLILVGQALDLYWVILPELGEGGPLPGVLDVGPLLLLVGILGLLTGRFLARNPAMAVGDPMLSRSADFHL